VEPEPGWSHVDMPPHIQNRKCRLAQLQRLSYPEMKLISNASDPNDATNKAKVMSQRIFMMPILRQLECLLPTGSLVCLKDRFWPILLKKLLNSTGVSRS